MDDPLVSLASTLHSAKGVYALLLGSGISRSAGIPTGWEVMQDLIRRIAALEGINPSDPEAWFVEKYRDQPDYSELLATLAISPAERTKLLQQYFEATDEELSEGLKVPTIAHRAIARLVSKGYIRVIVTTNFDRLLEQALTDVGIQPSVIVSRDSLLGSLPLVHATCTVIKINGDYLDPRFRNTRDELNGYEPEMESLLDRVFDEYGLLICGWSGDWDIGLRSAIQRCSSRRFTTYWASRGALGEHATRVAANRQAKTIAIESADRFFAQIADSLDALESFAARDPLSAQVAVARTKRYLASPQFAIQLHDLATAETAEAIERTSLRHFPTDNENVSSTAVLRRIQQYDAISDVLLQILICIAYFGDDGAEELALRCFRRLVEAAPHSLGITVWIALRRYPALLLFYGMGIAAIANGKYGLLKRLFAIPIFDPSTNEYRVAGQRLHDFFVIERQKQNALLDRSGYTPLSDHLFDRLRGPLKAYFPSDSEYESHFIWFEYFYAIASLDSRLILSDAKAIVKANDAKDAAKYWVPATRFAWANVSLERRGAEEFPKAIRAGFFGEEDKLASAKLQELKTIMDRFVSRIRLEWRLL